MRDYTILLIDYSPPSIEKTLACLVGEGFRVEVAQDGIAGIEAFHKIQPDLALVEAMLPRKNGYEVCRELKTTERGRDTPVLVVESAFRVAARQQTAPRYKFDGLVEKPVQTENLLAIIRACLHSRPPDDLAGYVPACAEVEGKAESEIDERLDVLLGD